MHYPFIFEEINIFFKYFRIYGFCTTYQVMFYFQKIKYVPKCGKSKTKKKKEKWLWLKFYPSQVFLFLASNSNHDLLKRNIFFRKRSSHNKTVKLHQRSSHAHGQTTIKNSREYFTVKPYDNVLSNAHNSCKN